MKSRIIAAMLAAVLAVSAILPVSAASKTDISKVWGRKSDNAETVVRGTNTFPQVSDAMCTAEYWIARTPNATVEILSRTEIDALNESIVNTAGANMVDLEKLQTVYDGNKLKKEMNDPYKYLLNSHYINGKVIDEAYCAEMKANVENIPTTTADKVRYGILVNRSAIKAFPYAEDVYLSDEDSDPDWDDYHNATGFINEAVIVYFTTADGKYSYIHTINVEGWTATENIAFCADRAEWLAAKNFTNRLVVTGTKVVLEGAAEKEINEKILHMGTILEIADKHESDDRRATYYNTVVKIPCRADDGSYYTMTALVPRSADVSVGYLPFTTANVLELAFKYLGMRYGYGGSLAGVDCSFYLRTIYRCMGIYIALNTTHQMKMPTAKNISLSEKSTAEKKAVLDDLRPGSFLYIPGHAMMYLGKVGGEYYTINASGYIINPETDTGILYTREIMVNTLSVKRLNGATWLDSLLVAVGF